MSLPDETGFGHLGQETSRGLDIERAVLDSEVATKVVNNGVEAESSLLTKAEGWGAKALVLAHTRAKVWWRKSWKR